MFKYAVIFVMALAAANAVDVQFSACSGTPTPPIPHWVRSEMCTPTICTLTRGTVWRGLAEFSLSETHHQLISTTTAFIFGIPIVVDIPAGYEDACLFHEGRVGTNSCPLEAGEIFTWDLHSPIDGSFPAQTNIPLEIKILQGTSVSLCARMNVNVV